MSDSFIATPVVPRVCLIVAVRNGADCLDRCLSAIANSNCDADEVVVVDDASTDNTVTIAEAYGVKIVRMARRGGPGAARNLGARATGAPILFFVDADVCIRPDAVERVLACMETHPEIDAVFGSYDDAPASPNLISQYKNLFHRFIHQQASAEACTFWSGCGAIRRSAFESVGGFDVKAPTIEDIELGVRMRKAGRRIRLDKSLEATHLKTWRLVSLVRSDVIDRGIAWTRLILRERNLPTDLNLTLGQRLSAFLTCLMLGMTLVGSWWRPVLAALPLLAMLVVWAIDRLPRRLAGTGQSTHASPLLRAGAVALVAGILGILISARGWGIAIGAVGLVIGLLNLPFYRFFVEMRGFAFTILVVPLHLLYFFYSVVSLATGILLHLLEADGGTRKWRRLALADATNRRLQSKPLPARLNSPRTRCRIYAILVGFLFILAWATQGMKSVRNHEAVDFVVSDAEGYWVYLPALVIGRDLRLTRPIAFHAQVHPIAPGSFPDTPDGLQNRWPIGEALTLAPSFLLAHAMSLTLSHGVAEAVFAPNGYSLLYQLFAMLTIMGMTWGAMVAIDGVAHRHFHLGGAAICAGVIVCVVGSNWVYYIFREPFMAHALGAAWIILAMASAERLTAAARRGRVIAWHGAALVFTLSMAVACRHTNAVILPVAIWAAAVVIDAGLLTPWLRRLPLLLIAAIPFVIYLLVFRMMSARHPVHPGFGAYRQWETFYWLHPEMLQILVSNFHGLFFWSPVLLWAIWGFAWSLWRPSGRRDGLLLSILISLIALWYVNGAWYAWTFGKSFGNRGFVDLMGIFVIGAAFAFESLGRKPARWPRGILAALAAMILINWVLLSLFILNKVPREAPLWGKFKPHATKTPG